jgi:thiol-disulfide isomerase/thioredoxin
VEVALFLARLLLAVVFAVAGIAKLADREGTRRALTGFGVPGRLAVPGAIALPVAELAVAVLMLPASTASWGAFGALVLLGSFVAAIAVNLLRGRAPDCHCFGAFHSEPAGPKTLVRNAVLAGVAVFVAIRAWNEAGTSATAWVGRLDTEGVALLFAVLAFALAVSLGVLAFVHLLRQHGRILLRLDHVEQVVVRAGLSLEVEDEMPEIGNPPGAEAPELKLEALDRTDSGLATLLDNNLPVLLVFTSPTCGPCRALMPSLARWQRIHASVVTIAVVSAGAEDEIRAEAEEYGLKHVLLDPELAAYKAYRANGTPSAVLIGSDGRIASWVASGSEWIERLLTDSLTWGQAAAEQGTSVGEPAPSVDLADLDGNRVGLSEAFSGETVVLFWNPGCGFCRRMHLDLMAWEVGVNESAPRLVIVSAGDAEEVRAEGFRSTVLLDPEWSALSAFRASGTPAAVRIDAEGLVASRQATGAHAVFELLASLPAPR